MNPVRPQVIVTGLSGLIGTRFHQLYGDVYELVNLDLTHGIDITNSQQVQAVFRQTSAEAVIHLAAFTDVNAAHAQQSDTDGACYRVNVLGTRVIAEAAQLSNKFLVHVSTDYVFDGTSPSPYTETDTTKPLEWYGQTKLMAEQAVAEIQPKHAILRMAFPYQAQPKRPDFLAKIMNRLATDTLPPAFDDHFLTPTFADDVAGVFNHCLKHQPTGLYHMTGSSSHSDYEIAELVKQTFDLPGEVKRGSLIEYQKTVNRPYQQTMRISNQKLTQDFGLKMRSFPEGLEIIKQQLV